MDVTRIASLPPPNMEVSDFVNEFTKIASVTSNGRGTGR